MLLVRLALTLFETAHSALLYGRTERCWLVAGRVQQKNQFGVQMKEEGGVPQTSIPLDSGSVEETRSWGPWLLNASFLECDFLSLASNWGLYQQETGLPRNFYSS